MLILSHKKLAFVIMAFLGVAVLSWNVFDTQTLAIGKNSLPALIIYGGLAVLLQMAGHWIRSVKHTYLLEQIRPIHTLEVFKGQMIGLLFNSIFPFRLGEIVRAHYIGKGVSISRSAVFTTIIFERFLDTLVIAIIGLILIIQLQTAPSSLIYATLILTAITLAIAIGLLTIRSQAKWLLRLIYIVSNIFNDTLKNRIRMICWSSIYCAKNVITAEKLPRYVLMTGAMWIFYILSVYVFVFALLPHLPFIKQAIASLAVYFGVSIPSGPAYLGTFQGIFRTVSAIPDSILQASNAPFVLWTLLVVPTAILGFTFLLSKQQVYDGKSDDVLNVLRNKLYRDTDITNEFAHFLDAYFRGDEINRILTTQELKNNFQVLKTFKGGSSALTLLAWQNDRKVVKKITLKQYQEKLQAQYLWLNERKNLPSIARALAEYDDDSSFYAIDIEYRDDYIPFFDIIHSSSLQKSKKILLSVCDFVDKNIYKNKKKVKDAARLLDVYIESKIIGKITDAANASIPIANLLGYEMVTVNGRELLNFDSVLKRITSHTQAMSDLTEIIECPIQGDLTIDNLIVNPTTHDFIILDPNNENAISDPVVDYGKLMQSVHSGYEFLYSVSGCKVQKNIVNFEENRSTQYNNLYEVLDSYLQDKLTPGRYRAVLFHEAVHYCRMLTYRVSINPDTAAVFYCIAVRLFNEFIEQYEDIPKH